MLTGGKIYGLLDDHNQPAESSCLPQEKDIVIAGEKILSIMDPSKTSAFIDSIRNNNLSILPISIQNQIIIPGLVDVHVHAIGGGGEQGLLINLKLLNCSKFYCRSIFTNSGKPSISIDRRWINNNCWYIGDGWIYKKVSQLIIQFCLILFIFRKLLETSLFSLFV